MQLMRDYNDHKPILIDSMMEVASASWSHDGSVLVRPARLTLGLRQAPLRARDTWR